MAKSWTSPRYIRLRALLIEARKRNDMSQAELAALLDKPQSFVSKFETGERRLDVVELIDVTAKLDCNILSVIESLLLMEA